MKMNIELSRVDLAIMYLLSKAKEKGMQDLSKFQIMKLIYLIEAESQRYTGKSFFGDINFIRQKNGPISTDIYYSLKKLEDVNCIRMKETHTSDYAYPRHGYSLTNEAEVDFSNSERIFLNSIIESYMKLPQKTLKQVVYKTEPMQEIVEKERKNRNNLIGSKLNLDLIPLDKDVLELISD